MTTPRIRTDLQATPLEDQGIKYFDVNDPRSGARMRMYDFEWLIAERMDGARRFDEVASWAKERLGVSPSADDLAEYARKLRELGFFELGAAHPSVPVKTIEVEAEEADEDLTPLPDPMPAERVAEPPPAPASKDEIIAVSPTMAMPAAKPPEPVKAPEPLPPTPTPGPPSLVGKSPPRRAQPEVDATGSTGKVDAPAPKKSGSGSLIFLFLVILGVGGAVVYMQYLRPQAVHVAVTLATPREVVQLFDGQGVARASEPKTLSFGEDGKVTEVVAKGAAVKAGTPLATLDSYAQVEKQLADLKDRERFYERQLTSAQAKNDAAELKLAEAKVAEKKKLITELEARALKVRLVAPQAGTVSEVKVASGADVKAGAPVVTLGGEQLTVQFSVPAADAPKVGDAASVQTAAGATLSGKVAEVAGGVVTIDLAEGAAKTGDALKLVRKRDENVVPLPTAAVVQRNGEDVVFVLADGEARMRRVTVDRSNPTQALVSSGLATGDSVITSGADALSDGQKVVTP